MNTKELVQILKQIDNKFHYDIFIILKKYGIQYTKNSNGIFFNLETIDQDILNEIHNYLQISAFHPKTTYDQSSSSETNAIHIANDNGAVFCTDTDPDAETNDKSKKHANKTLNDECDDIVRNVLDDDKTKVLRILHDIDKEKCYIHKKAAINKFSVAKKKYAKQVLTAIEYHDLSNLLDYDS